jgi:thioredoxin reductase (NADPH)
MYDVIVLGKGPAGIQAAVYIKRSNLNVLVIGKDGGALSKTDKIGNYFGFTQISGPELLEEGFKHAKALNIDLIDEEVTGLSFGLNFEVTTTLNSYHAKAVILATGSPRATVRIPNLKELEGRGVSYCAICDAFFYRKKIVGVLGHGDYAAQEAHELVNVADQVIVFTNGLEPVGHFDPRVKFVKNKIKNLVGTDRLQAVTLDDESTVDVSGLFIALGSASATDLALKIGALVENNKIIVDDKKQTNVPGLFAAGDCTPGIMQIAKAVGDGCVAGLESIAFIRNLK